MSDEPTTEESKSEGDNKIEVTIHPSTPTEPEQPQASESEAESEPESESKVEDEAHDEHQIVVVDHQPAKRGHFGFLKKLVPENIFPGPLRRKFGPHARMAGSLTIIVLLTVIGTGTLYKLSSNHSSTTKGFQAKVVPFKLVSTIPDKDAENVNINSKVTLNFNQPVDPTKIGNDIFISPTVNGTYTRGKTAEQIIFTPAKPFVAGTKITVMLNGTYQSLRGSKLGADYYYGFTTSIPADGVDFEDQNGTYDQVTSLSSGQSEKYTVHVGTDVAGGKVKVTLYKGTAQRLLESLGYTTTTDAGGYSYPQFSDHNVNTSGFTVVGSQDGVADGGSYSATEPDGLYVAVATDSNGKQVGFVWLDLANYGVLLRQDDQKVVVDAQDFNGQDVPADISFYNLNNGVNLLDETSIDGLTTRVLPYKPSLDIAVATYNGEEVIVPVAILNSQGDIRADQDLSQTNDIYGTTDKPSYKVGDDVRFAGFVRTDNDVHFAAPSSGQLQLYVASYKGGTSVDNLSVNVDASGMISGSLAPSSSWLASGDKTDKFQIFAKSADGNSSNDVAVAGFSVTSQSNSADNVSVSFGKSSYLASDKVTATIIGTDASGKPLANATVDVHTYSEDYYENDAKSNLDDFGNLGVEIKGSPTTVQLDGNGRATYTLNNNELPADGSSQQVTVQAHISGATGAGGAGGATAVVHQGNGSLTFGIGRNNVAAGSKLVSRVYAKNLNGSSLANASVNYQLVNNDESQSVIASGTATTDGSGYAEIDINVPASLSVSSSLKMVASISDQYNNKIQASTYYTVSDGKNGVFDTSGAVLQDLDVSGSSGNVSVGDTVNLTINSPEKLSAMVTMDRGRIYSQQMLSLNKGDNTFSFKVTSDLAPSFTLTFNYFRDGVYHSEGVQFNVGESPNLASVKLTAGSVHAGQASNLQINVKDANGQPLATQLIVSAVSSNGYALNSTVNRPIFDSFYVPRVIMTSSSSSLTAIGSGGGKCGGGGGDSPAFTDAVGTVGLWQPGVTTDGSGNASVSFTPPSSGSWKVNVYEVSGNTIVGSASTTVTAN